MATFPKGWKGGKASAQRNWTLGNPCPEGEGIRRPCAERLPCPCGGTGGPPEGALTGRRGDSLGASGAARRRDLSGAAAPQLRIDDRSATNAVRCPGAGGGGPRERWAKPGVPLPLLASKRLSGVIHRVRVRGNDNTHSSDSLQRVTPHVRRFVSRGTGPGRVPRETHSPLVTVARIAKRR